MRDPPPNSVATEWRTVVFSPSTMAGMYSCSYSPILGGPDPLHVAVVDRHGFSPP
ncbi:MAG: hypothetical protein U0797_12325 [Gemmataceae bacterium]